MQELDVEGLFWRPEEPERKIAGRLRFDSADGATLSLVEPTRLNATGVTRVPITDLLAGGPDAEDAVRFLGATGSHVLTLDGCLLTRSSMGSTGMTHRHYRVTTVLIGVHLGSEEPMSFTSASVELSNLASWVGRSGLCVEPVSAKDSEKPSGLRLTYEQVPAVEANTDDGSISVRFPWRYKWNPFGKSTIEHECAFECRFREPQPLAKLMEVCQGLRNLVTICVQAPSVILDAKLTHADSERPVGWYEEWIGAGSRNEKATVERPKMALTCDDIGGLEGIGAWLKLANRYSVVIALLVSHWYVPPLYQEQRYFNAFVAAESLIRIRKQEQNIKTLKELIDLAERIETLFVPLVGDLGTWAGEVVQTRNNYVVHPGRRGSGDGHRLYLLSESIYLLVVLSLLLECGVAEDSLKNVLNHDHYRWLVEEFAKSASRTNAEKPCPKHA